jgi:hypothetical protein
MRWRRFAASVWPTDTDSTKPINEISAAGSSKLRHQRQVKPTAA